MNNIKADFLKLIIDEINDEKYLKKYNFDYLKTKFLLDNIKLELKTTIKYINSFEKEIYKLRSDNILLNRKIVKLEIENFELKKKYLVFINMASNNIFIGLINKLTDEIKKRDFYSDVGFKVLETNTILNKIVSELSNIKNYIYQSEIEIEKLNLENQKLNSELVKLQLELINIKNKKN